MYISAFMVAGTPFCDAVSSASPYTLVATPEEDVHRNVSLYVHF